MKKLWILYTSILQSALLAAMDPPHSVEHRRPISDTEIRQIKTQTKHVFYAQEWKDSMSQLHDLELIRFIIQYLQAYQLMVSTPALSDALGLRKMRRIKKELSNIHIMYAYVNTRLHGVALSDSLYEDQTLNLLNQMNHAKIAIDQLDSFLERVTPEYKDIILPMYERKARESLAEQSIRYYRQRL